MIGFNGVLRSLYTLRYAAEERRRANALAAAAQAQMDASLRGSDLSIWEPIGLQSDRQLSLPAPLLALPSLRNEQNQQSTD